MCWRTSCPAPDLALSFLRAEYSRRRNEQPVNETTGKRESDNDKRVYGFYPDAQRCPLSTG